MGGLRCGLISKCTQRERGRSRLAEKIRPSDCPIRSNMRDVYDLLARLEVTAVKDSEVDKGGLVVL